MDEMVEVILRLPESSIRKVRSLAMLAGITVGDVESQMAQMFDDMLSHNIRSQLDAVDGKKPDDSPPKQYGFAEKSASYGEVMRVVQAPPKAVEEVVVDDNDHALSGDDDNGDGDAKSVEDEMQETDDDEVAGIADKPFSISVPDVGENADAFLDAAMRAPQTNKQPQGPQRTRAARTAFDPRAPRVRILSTAEDEDGDTTPMGFQ